MGMQCDILFGYSKRCEYVGLMNFRNVISMEVQRVFDASASLPPDTIVGVPPLFTGAYTGVIVNGINFGTGRIVSFKNPTSTDITENGRHLWKQIVGFEVWETGDASNLGTNPYITGFSAAYHSQLVSLEENLAFELPPEGDYQYTHTASIKCADSPTGVGESGFIVAARIASGLLGASPSLGLIDAVHSGMYTGAGKRTYSETTDMLNGTVSFEERFTIQNRDFLKHTFAFDNGIAHITENGIIRHSGTTASSGIFNGNPNNLITRMTQATGGGYSRCNALWGTYSGFFGIDAYSQNLSLQPVQVTKSFDETTQELNYTMVYTNNPNMTVSGYTIDREQTLGLTALGVTEATEQGSLTAYGFKNTSMRPFFTGRIANEITGAKSRLTDLWASISTFKETNEIRSYSVFSKRGGYSITFSNDPSFIDDGTYLTRTIAWQDNGAILMHTPYLIIGRNTPLVHSPGQTQFGTATCSVSANLVRPRGYYAGSPAKPDALNIMFVDAMNCLLPLVAQHSPLDMYISRVSYTYGSDWTAELVAEAQYVYARTGAM